MKRRTLRSQDRTLNTVGIALAALVAAAIAWGAAAPPALAAGAGESAKEYTFTFAPRAEETSSYTFKAEDNLFADLTVAPLDVAPDRYTLTVTFNQIQGPGWGPVADTTKDLRHDFPQQFIGKKLLVVTGKKLPGEVMGEAPLVDAPYIKDAVNASDPKYRDYPPGFWFKTLVAFRAREEVRTAMSFLGPDLLPKKPVRVGDSWAATLPAPFVLSLYVPLDFTFTLKGVDASGLATIAFTVSCQRERRGISKELLASSTAKGEGVIVYDMTAGRPVHVESNVEQDVDFAAEKTKSHTTWKLQLDLKKP